MSVLLIIGLTWTLLAVPAALVAGRALRSTGRSESLDWTDELEQFLREQPSMPAAG